MWKMQITQELFEKAKGLLKNIPTNIKTTSHPSYVCLENVLVCCFLKNLLTLELINVILLLTFEWINIIPLLPECIFFFSYNVYIFSILKLFPWSLIKKKKNLEFLTQKFCSRWTSQSTNSRTLINILLDF